MGFTKRILLSLITFLGFASTILATPCEIISPLPVPVIINGCTFSGGSLPPGSSYYIQNTNTLQTGATFYISSGTVTNLNVTNINGLLYPPSTGDSIYPSTSAPTFQANASSFFGLNPVTTFSNTAGYPDDNVTLAFNANNGATFGPFGYISAFNSGFEFLDNFGTVQFSMSFAAPEYWSIGLTNQILGYPNGTQEVFNSGNSAYGNWIVDGYLNVLGSSVTTLGTYYGSGAGLTSISTTSLSATGTASNTTFLRGDNTWSVPAGGGGGGSSSLSVGTGTASNYTTQVTSPTAVLSFLGSQFHSFSNGTTNFISLSGNGFINNQNTLQSGATFYVSSGTALNFNANDIYLPVTSASPVTIGVIYQNGSPLLQTTGTNNVFLGINSGNFNVTGTDNTGVGFDSLLNNTSGSDNFGEGSGSLYSNTTGYGNVGIGYRSLYSNVSSIYNTGIGTQALYSNTGSYNVGIGNQSLYSGTSGSYNIAIGWQAMYSGVVTAQYNIAIGVQALNDDTSGASNCALGVNALNYNTTGSNNIAMGEYALISNVSGGNNIGLGMNAGRANTNGSYLTFLGIESGHTGTNDGLSYSSALGSYAQVTANNTMVLSNSGSYHEDVTINATAGYGAALNVNPNNASSVAEIIRGASSQSADLQEWQNSSSFSLLKVMANGVISSSGTVPTLSGCGTGPSVIGGNLIFTITGGTASTGCTATFATALANTPTCTVSQQSMSLVNALSYTTSNTAITITQTGLGTNRLDVVCIAHD